MHKKPNKQCVHNFVLAVLKMDHALSCLGSFYLLLDVDFNMCTCANIHLRVACENLIDIYNVFALSHIILLYKGMLCKLLVDVL